MSLSPSIQLLTDAVIAQYIHEISARHRTRDPESGAGGDGRATATQAIGARPRRRLTLPASGLATAGQPD